MPENCEAKGEFGRQCRQMDTCPIARALHKGENVGVQKHGIEMRERNLKRALEFLLQNPECLRRNDLLIEYNRKLVDTHEYLSYLASKDDE